MALLKFKIIAKCFQGDKIQIKESERRRKTVWHFMVYILFWPRDFQKSFAYARTTYLIFGMIKYADNIYYCTKSQVRGLRVGGDMVLLPWNEPKIKSENGFCKSRKSTFVPLFMFLSIPYHLGYDIIGPADYLERHGWLNWLRVFSIDARNTFII